MEPTAPDRPRPSGGTVSLILGTAAVPALLLFGLGLFLGIAAVVTGVVALVRRDRAPGDPKRAAGGVALGLLALAGAVVLIARPDT
jgi:hypothetical protein